MLKITKFAVEDSTTFDTDAILSSAEAELYNSTTDVWNDLESFDTSRYCNELHLAMELDW